MMSTNYTRHKSKRMSYRAPPSWSHTVAAMFLTGLILGITGGIIYKVKNQPEPEVRELPREVSLVQDCAYLYDVGRSREWAECMGIPYR